MSKPIANPDAKRAEKTVENQGEGDKESAEKFNKMETDFVQSERGKRAIDTVINLDEEEQAEGEKAEREGKARTKGEDPAVTRADHRAKSSK